MTKLNNGFLGSGTVQGACAAACLTIFACGDTDDGDTGSQQNTAGATSPGTVTGDAVRGGALYDAYWKVPGVLGSAAPTTDHPLWASRPDTTSNMRTGPDTWRCKECHGWDYKGVAGRYGSGSHKTGFPGVMGTAATAAQIAAVLADPAKHNYGAVLSETDINDVAAFIKTGVIDTSTLIDAAGKFTGGDMAAGKASYDMSCMACHGADGLSTMPPGSAGGFEDFPGLIANDNPWEFVHKVRFGQPGTMMPPLDATLDAAGLSSLGAYSQSLPMAPL